jgi:raffinose/stachyose/melibiose transport system substrate-binding protein
MIKAVKTASIILVLAFLFSLPVGCGSRSVIENADNSSIKTGPSTGSDMKKKEQTIRVATTFTGGDPYTPVWQQVLTDFHSGNPDINVIDEATSAAGDTFKIKIYTDFASGNEPDVTYGFNGALGKTLVDSGKVISWEDELKADPSWAANFKPGPLETCKYMGKLYALPFLGFFEGMWINKDLFEKNGLDIPKTYADILKAIPVFNNKGITPIACAFSDEPHYLIETFILSMGGRDGHANPFDPSWAPALELIKELYDMKAFSEDTLTLKQVAAVELFAGKKAAMLVTGSWSQGNIKDLQNTLVIPLPVVPGGKADPTDIIGGAGTGWYLVRDLNDSKEGAGMKFIKYMTTPETIARFVSTAGVPCIKCDVKADSPMKQSGIDLMNNAKSVNGAVGDMLGQEVFGTIWHGLSDIVTGRKTTEQVLAEAKRQVKH